MRFSVALAYTTLVAFVVFKTKGINATLCYSCKNFRTSEDCLNSTVCTGQQGCFARADGHISGDVLYTVGCVSQSNSVETEKSFCTDICQEDLCNLDKCKIPVSPVGKVLRPQRCLECDLISDPSNCTHLVQCSHTEMCFVRHVVIFGKPYYRMGCMDKQHCIGTRATSSQPQIVGKRDAWSSGNCALCCSTDHCNSNACSQNHGIPPNKTHPLKLLGDNNTCSDYNDFACKTFGTLDGNACKLMPNIDAMCPMTCGLCGHYGWSEWGGWSSCSKTCDDGISFTHRTCMHQLNVTNTNVCAGDAVQNKTCNVLPCKVDGQWSAWGTWSTCSVSCGGGFRVRQRHCSNPQPQHGGALCIGNNKETEKCSETHCPVNGGWCSGYVSSRCYRASEGIFRDYSETSAHERTSCACPSPRYGVDGGWCFSTRYLCKHFISDLYTTAGSVMIRSSCNCPAPKYGGRSCN